MGADHMTKAIMFEASGYSMLGPIAMNIAAPDEGNMHLFDEVATEAQKEQYLRPLAAGDKRSVFLMTEPSPGAGSDPSAMLTDRAAGWERLEDQWNQVVDHRGRGR